MTAVRQFKDRRVLYGDKLVAGIEIACGKCSATFATPKGSTKSFVHPGSIEEARRYIAMFERAGWHVARRPQEDRCPSCAAKLGLAKPRQPAEPVNTVMKEKLMEAMTPTGKAPEPKPMSREDGRLIFAKLEEVYRDEKHGYQNGWSDHKVSTDMGVPRAWVEEVRKKFFGPEGGNEEARKVLDEARALVTSAQQLRAEAHRLAAYAEEIAAKGEAIQRRIDRIEQTVGR